MVCLGKQSFKLSKGCLPQILLGPFLNSLSRVKVVDKYNFASKNRKKTRKIKMLYGN